MLQEFIKERRRRGLGNFMPGRDFGWVARSIDEVLADRQPDFWRVIDLEGDEPSIFFVFDGSVTLWRLEGAGHSRDESDPEVEIRLLGPLDGGELVEYIRAGEGEAIEFQIRFRHDSIPGGVIEVIAEEDELAELDQLRRYLAACAIAA